MPTHRIYAIASSERWHAASAPAPLPGAMRSAACGSIRCASESAGGHVIKFRQATLDALEPFKWDGGACCQTTKLKLGSCSQRPNAPSGFLPHDIYTRVLHSTFQAASLERIRRDIRPRSAT